MKIFARTLLSGLFAASFAFTACDSDESTPAADTAQGTDTNTEADTSSEADTSMAADTGTAADTGPAEDTAQGADTNTSNDAGGEDMTQPDTTPSEDTSAGAGACDNSADLAVIGANNPADKAAACGTSATCLPLALQQKVDEFETCVRDCMLDANRPNFAYAVSVDCTECYVDSVRCTATLCLGECAANPSSDGCVSCRETKGCTPDFYTCSGLPNN